MCYSGMYKDISDKVIIGVTTRAGFKWVSKYKSNYHFFKTIMYSCNLMCISSLSHKYLDGIYAHIPFRDLPPKTLILHTTYNPPICLIPFSDPRIVDFLYNKGYIEESRAIDVYRESGMEYLVEYNNDDYKRIFVLHEMFSVTNPKWKKKLKRLFHDNGGR